MIGASNSLARWIGGHLGRYPRQRQHQHTHGTAAAPGPARLMACLMPGDALLVQGQSRISVALKYLTQSTWSPAALYVGDSTGRVDHRSRPRCFQQADVRHPAQPLIDGADAVFRPAEDSGDVRVGLRQPQPALFRGMTWCPDQSWRRSVRGPAKPALVCMNSTC
jgi:hypothetical protein